MIRNCMLLAVGMGCLAMGFAQAADFRPPAVPLVTLDPYTSVWSPSDHLYDAWPMHWTGAVTAMGGMIRVDDKPYRYMGTDALCPEAVQQTGLEVRPTQTIYRFEAGGVELTLTFMTPMLPDDLALLSAPVSYITWSVRALDGKEHEVALYFDASAEWVINKPVQEVVWSRSKGPDGLELLQFGSKDQPVLAKDGDNIRIDWGYFYVGVPAEMDAQTVITAHDKAREGFVKNGKLPKKDDDRMPRAAKDEWPVIAAAISLEKVGAEPVSRHILLAYDDLYSIEYMQEKLRAWWTREYADLNAMLAAFTEKYPALVERCNALDAELIADARQAGGEEYAKLIGLSFRHVFASGKIVSGPTGDPWYFHKECFSNGCTATVDVSYPASPFFALLSPVLLEGMMAPVLDFAMRPEWTFPFAPHDVGRYPKANGQVYSAGKIEGQMPVEECGNMILMAALAAEAKGNTAFIERHWALLMQWANYLKEKGLDPENQLCTDDFAGHLAHNANLSMKAINALGAFARLCDMMKKPEAAGYWEAARAMAAEWPKLADDGDHYRLAFDQPGTWSMKYNLVWDRIFKMGLFPEEIYAKELAQYHKVQNTYGIPLDNRKDYTKTDWLIWCATLSKDPAEFAAFIAPVYKFCQETPDRAPFTDWYDTKTAKCVGFRARPVIGGIFIKCLADEALWSKWRQRADNQ